MGSIGIHNSIRFYHKLNNGLWYWTNSTTGPVAWISYTNYFSIVQLNLNNFKANEMLTSIELYADLTYNSGQGKYIKGYLCEKLEDAENILNPSNGNENPEAKYIQSTTGALDGNLKFTLNFDRLSILNNTKNLFVLLQADSEVMYDIYDNGYSKTSATPTFQSIGITVETSNGFEIAIPCTDRGTHWEQALPCLDKGVYWELCS